MSSLARKTRRRLPPFSVSGWSEGCESLIRIGFSFPEAGPWSTALSAPRQIPGKELLGNLVLEDASPGMAGGFGHAHKEPWDLALGPRAVVSSYGTSMQSYKTEQNKTKKSCHFWDDATHGQGAGFEKGKAPSTGCSLNKGRVIRFVPGCADSLNVV